MVQQRGRQGLVTKPLAGAGEAGIPDTLPLRVPKAKPHPTPRPGGGDPGEAWTLAPGVASTRPTPRSRVLTTMMI